MTATAVMSKSHQAYLWIKQSITARSLTPGCRLVLATIAGELDMSVVPVREAIRQLEAEGLVTYEFNVGARVSLVNVTQYRDSMQTLGLVEAAATALSARALTAADVRAARAVNARMAAQLEQLDPHAFTELNQEFHMILFRHCPNARLLDLVKAEWLRLNGLRDSTFAFVPERARDSVDEHERILGLIERGAPLTQIEKMVRSHRNATLRAFAIHEYPHEASRLATNI